MRAGFTIPPSRVTPSLPQTPEAIVKYRCDYCGGHLGPIVHRYYRMRFCCKAHMSAYEQRLTMETRAKIRQLELVAFTENAGAAISHTTPAVEGSHRKH